MFLGNLFSQHRVLLNFKLKNGHEDFSLNQNIQDLNGEIYSINEVAFYISSLEIRHDGGQVIDLKDTVFIVNYKNSVLDLGIHQVDEVEGLSFDVGVPFELNHLDISQYPENHPLSFQQPSMHWGWTSGYTFFLLNGFGDVDGDGLATNPFQIHCIGNSNLKHQNLVNKATIHGDGTREIFQITNIDQWIRGVSPTSGAHHGNPSIDNVVMNNILNHPVFTSPENANLNELHTNLGNVKFSNEDEKLIIYWNGMKNLETIHFFDTSGKQIQTVNKNSAEGNYTLIGLPVGMYIVKFSNIQKHTIHTKHILKQ
jgi:hypothetical protein